MAKDENSKLIIIRPTDVSSSKTSDFAEKIISGIMESGELDVIGVGDAMFLSCAAVTMATEIANVFIDEILHRYIRGSAFGKNKFRFISS